MPQGSKQQVKETLYFNDSYFDAILDDIANAKKSIDLEVYIFSKDELGDRVAKSLVDAARRGVKVRVLVDGIGSPSWEQYYAEDLEKVGIEAKLYRPLPWLSRRWLQSKPEGSVILKILYLIFKINRRNHRKTCTIDSNIVYVGSANITKDHLSKDKGGDGWRDTTIRLENINPKNLRIAFEKAWKHFSLVKRATLNFKKISKNPVFRLNHSWHQRRTHYKKILKRIRKSRKKIWITNPYFMPRVALLRSLTFAAKKGSDVKILLAQRSDVFFYPWVMRLFYTKLLDAGISIYEYKPAVMHAKTIIIDNYYLVGSSNLNNRSLMHDLEVDVHVRSPEIKKSLREQFLQDLSVSDFIEIDKMKPLSKVKTVLAWLILYLRYWL